MRLLRICRKIHTSLETRNGGLARINTLNLKPLSAEAQISVYRGDLQLLQVKVKAGQDWQSVVNKFNTGDLSATDNLIYIKLNTDAASVNTGFVYFDDVLKEPILFKENHEISFEIIKTFLQKTVKEYLK